MQKKIFFGGKFYFFPEKNYFSAVFSAFHGQRSVKAARATRSPWSVILKNYLHELSSRIFFRNNLQELSSAPGLSLNKKKKKIWSDTAAATAMLVHYISCSLTAVYLHLQDMTLPPPPYHTREAIFYNLINSFIYS